VCGRYVLYADPKRLRVVLELSETPRDLVPRYNIAPTQEVPAVRARADGGRELVMLRWGLVPPGSAGPGSGYRMINARAETAHLRPAFKGPLARHRCLIPADGFYEWRRDGRRARPYYIHPAGAGPFALAGLWARWRGTDGTEVASCAILTTPANAVVAPIHDRMPAILAPADFALWLDPAVTDPEAVGPLLVPAPPEGMALHPVGPAVNNPRSGGPGLIEPG